MHSGVLPGKSGLMEGVVMFNEDFKKEYAQETRLLALVDAIIIVVFLFVVLVLPQILEELL